LGLVLTIPISVWSSRTSLGAWSKQRGLFLTPEEVNPPPILERMHRELAETESRPWAASRDALQWILEDAQIREAHLAMLDSRAKEPDPLRQNYLEGLRLKVSPTGAHTLTPKEKRDLLLDGDSIRALHANWSLGT
jgi:membrane glycosyltransferase